ncbi:broad specificity phosphatase PhoE [Natronocella acetinitrilica]|uniref:Broad specificity phosphatase PhoE n=1 Tax=Natronocella acetinitrilica TaxID=414046 RepID=A0AAE3G4A3_9GAMM|nr:histidine phosphatase family protein [Natronocella acetinitrilica]MCP1675540.1 broad specificity phosphatase PhoE [Natronocella acetinitrilica]
MLKRLLLLFLLSLPMAATATDAVWEALQEGGHAVLMRHALAPGTGDPAGFVLEDCTTQRNLSAGGRRQAERMGELFRAQGLGDLTVYTSRWCRSRDTAEALDLGPVTELEALDSFFAFRDRRDTALRGMREAIIELQGGPSVVMVTHQVNITGTVSNWVNSGEAVVVRADDNGGIIEVGRIPAPSSD